MIDSKDSIKMLKPFEDIYDICQPLCEYLIDITTIILASFAQHEGFKDEINIVKGHFENDDYNYEVIAGLVLGLSLSNVGICLMLKHNLVKIDDTAIFEDFIMNLPITSECKSAALKNLIYSYSCDQRVYKAITRGNDTENLVYRKFEWIIDVLISGNSFIKYGDNKKMKLDTIKHSDGVYLESDLISEIGFTEHPLLSMFAYCLCQDGNLDMPDSSGYLKTIGDLILNINESN